MSFLPWRQLTTAFCLYVLAVAIGYRFIWEPAPSALLAVEAAMISVLGVGPRPLSIQQQSNFALVFDIAVMLVGFVLRIVAIGMAAAMFAFSRRTMPAGSRFASRAGKEEMGFASSCARDRVN